MYYYNIDLYRDYAIKRLGHFFFKLSDKIFP